MSFVAAAGLAKRSLRSPAVSGSTYGKARATFGCSTRRSLPPADLPAKRFKIASAHCCSNQLESRGLAWASERVQNETLLEMFEAWIGGALR